MTKITLSSNASGTGNVNFAAPNTNSSITVTLPTSNVDMDALGPSTALNAVGTYALLIKTSGAQVYSGVTVSGSDYDFTSASGKVSATNPNPAGTWRLMGYLNGDLSSEAKVSVFVRIS